MVSAEEEYQKNEENCADEKERKVFEDKKGERRTELIFRKPDQPAKPAAEPAAPEPPKADPEPKPAEPEPAEPEPKPEPKPAEPSEPEAKPEPKPAEPEPQAEPKPAEPAPAPAKDPQKEEPVPAEANKEADAAEAKEAVAADGNATVVEGNASAPAQPFLPSDFFSGALEAAGQSDPMGTQRIVDVRSGRLTPSLAFSMGYNYTSNPMKVGKDSAGYIPDGFTALLNMTFNMGLGEYGVGDDVLLTPSLSLMHMRTYTDPSKDHGNQMEDFDVDVQVASVTLPIILPDDYTLSLGHAYVRPISFHADNVISYSNSPSVTLIKTLPLASGDVISLTAGTSYAFSNGDTLEQQIADAEYYNFIEAVMGGAANVLAQQPVNAQDAWTHTLNFTYIKPIGEQITLTPSATMSRMEFTEGINNGRDDTSYLLGVLASYAISEWMNVSASTNYMWKRSSIAELDFEDFIGGVTMGFNYSF